MFLPLINCLPKYKITLPNRELACCPFSSTEGTDYFNAMAAAANFAWANRQLINWEVRKVFLEMFNEKLTILYDVVDVVDKAQIAKKVVKLKPMVVIKG